MGYSAAMEGTLKIAQDADVLAKARALIGHYDQRVYLSSAGYVDVGRGSFDAIRYVDFVESTEGCIGTVGQFCNFAKPCHLHGGGEHHNDLPVNVMLYNIPALMAMGAEMPELRAKRHVPFTLGDGVLVSAHAQIMSGAQIGDGAVIGAGAVVTGKVEPYTIVGGVPAKVIRRREVNVDAIQAVRWWDFDTGYMAENLRRLQAMAVDRTTAHVYRKPSPTFILKWDGVTLNIAGYIVEGATRRMEDAPASVKEYLLQLKGPGPYKWRSDIWAA
jgi:acetyltransferase-like isoleucine patch superfamily enzyme